MHCEWNRKLEEPLWRSVSVKNFQKLKAGLLYDPATPLLSICPKDQISYSTALCSAVFTTALLEIPRKWKQPKCPSAEEWTLKMQYLDVVEFYWAARRKMKS